MIDSPPPTQALNSYNVAQLQYALHDGKPPRIESLTDVHVLDYLSPSASPALLSGTPLSPSRLPAPELDYDSRRMSSSTTSDSSLQSRPDHRALSRSPPRPADPWPHTPSPQPADRRPADPADPARVQLPSLASAFTDRHDARRASLPTLFDPRHRPPPPAPGLAGYQFPADAPDDRRGVYAGPPPDYAALPSGSSYAFSPAPSSSSGFASAAPSAGDDWPARPSSTPGSAPRYDDALRHGSHPSLFGGVTRIAGHAVRGSAPAAAVKSEGDAQWTFPAPDAYPHPAPPPMSTSPPAAPGSPPQPPAQAPQQQGPSLVERQPRKRGKLPKPVTDFLKEWLHRHSDHPYPSEEEKKQLCNATGLSMSQVSNWMINARRRILAPAHRAAAGPTTTAPFPGRSASSSLPLASSLSSYPLSGSPLDTGRRASVPTDSLQLYYPMSLQPLDGLHAHGGQTRQMVGMARSYSSSSHPPHAGAAGVGYSTHGSSPYAYSGGAYPAGALHPAASGSSGSGYLGLSSSGSGSGSGYMGGAQGGMYSSGYGGRLAHDESQGQAPQARYTFPPESPQPGAGGYGGSR